MVSVVHEAWICIVRHVTVCFDGTRGHEAYHHVRGFLPFAVGDRCLLTFLL